MVCLSTRESSRPIVLDRTWGSRAGRQLCRASWPDTTPETERGAIDKPLAEGKAAIGAKFDAGDYTLSVKEVRYWVGMNVRHDPGKPIVLSSLWVGFAGMVITFIGRLRRGRKQSGGSDQLSVDS